MTIRNIQKYGLLAISGIAITAAAWVGLSPSDTVVTATTSTFSNDTQTSTTSPTPLTTLAPPSTIDAPPAVSAPPAPPLP
ncbi:hypothetical protein [Mycobacterium sp.]|uniref:hypothetical protein n=1 Tax=Mycobacterium sp. TaxID=1785 RepID=UPI003C75FA17